MARALKRAADSATESAARAFVGEREDSGLPARTFAKERPDFESVVQAALRECGHALTDYQRAFLDDPAPLRAVLKARQVGFSWVFALEALAAAIATGQFSIFVSLNREEAAEKILYARDIYDSLPAAIRPPLLRAGTHEIRLAGGGRLLSFPCRAPRGKASASLYMDEMAFYPKDALVYTGALPVVSHGGRVTLASTPNGERGMFWRAVADADLSGQFSQHRVPWWRAPWFSTDIPAAVAAGEMDTEERVRRFGTPVLTRLFAAMDRDAFRQEYELRFLDAAGCYYPWPEIDACVVDIPLAQTWNELARTGAPLYAGMDIGRTHDATAIVVVSADRDGYTVRFVRTLSGETFAEQEEAAAGALEAGGVSALAVDATGLGSEFAERLSRRFPNRVMPLSFTLELKNRMAVRVRSALQTGALRLPRRDALLNQMHAIRRIITDSANVRFDSPRDGAGHADEFWALTMALHAAQEHTPAASIRFLRPA